MLKDVLDNLPDLEEDKNVCIALSGGLDSTTLVYILAKKYGKDKVKAISFDFGQRHKIELQMAQKTASLLGIEHKVIELQYLGEISKGVSSLIEDSDLKPKTAEENAGDPQVNTYVPWRNAQFAFITAAYAEANRCQFIFQATNAVDQYGYFDTTAEFTKRINDVLELNRQHLIQFITPFVELHKDDELKIARELSTEVDYDILENTWSCYNGDNGSGKECGRCNTCTEKLTGYILAGYSDKDILNKFDILADDLNKMKKDILG